MKKSILLSVGLILVLVYTQIAETSSDVSSYDIMADINRDRIVDASDLARLGNAYGSRLVLPSEPNKTIVTVLSFDKEPPQVENARVAIIDPEVCGTAVNVTYTNSSGTALFDLSPSKNYTVIAWSGSAYNYANFTTNPLGEASVLTLLGDQPTPPVKSLPEGWIVITFLENETGSLYFLKDMAMVYGSLTCDILYYNNWSFEDLGYAFPYGGVFVTPLSEQINKPHSRIGIVLIHPTLGTVIGSSVYSPDENGCANVIVYVTPP